MTEMAAGELVNASARRRPRMARRMFASLAVVLLVAGAVMAGYRWTHPSLFRDGDAGGLSTFAQPLTKFPLYVGFGFPDGENSTSISVDRVKVHLGENTAGFTAKVLVCTQGPVDEGALAIGTMYVDDGELSEFCTSVRPVEPGTRMTRKKTGGDYFVAVLTPARAGSAHIERIDITYSRGVRHFFQRGTQHVSQDIELAAKS